MLRDRHLGGRFLAFTIGSMVLDNCESFGNNWAGMEAAQLSQINLYSTCQSMMNGTYGAVVGGVSFVGQGNGSTTLGNAVLDAYASDLGEFAGNRACCSNLTCPTPLEITRPGAGHLKGKAMQIIVRRSDLATRTRSRSQPPTTQWSSMSPPMAGRSIGHGDHGAGRRTHLSGARAAQSGQQLARQRRDRRQRGSIPAHRASLFKLRAAQQQRRHVELHHEVRRRSGDVASGRTRSQDDRRSGVDLR